jgi:hypothetical protein
MCRTTSVVCLSGKILLACNVLLGTFIIKDRDIILWHYFPRLQTSKFVSFTIETLILLHETGTVDVC